MGLLDRLLRPFRRTPAPEPEPEPEPVPAPTPVAAKPPRPVKAPRPAPPPKAPKVKKERPQGSRKARKHQAPPARQPDAEVLPVAEAERRYRALLDAQATRPTPEAPPPVPVAEEQAPPPPTEPRRTEPRPPRARRRAAAPEYERLVSRAEALLAVPTAEGAHLVAARRELVDSWARLGPPEDDDASRLLTARDTTLAALDERVAAAVAARRARWEENLAQRLAIVEEAKALAGADDLKGAGPAMGALRARLRAAGEVSKEQGAAVDAAFAEAEAQLKARQAALRDGRDAARAEQLEQLARLVTQAEALAKSRDPEVAAERVKALQTAWKEVRVPGPRGEADALWTRFRAACDAVFTRRTEARAANAKVATERLERIVLQAEALVASEAEGDPDTAIRALMTEWKRVGRAPREVQEALWERLRKAFDALRSPGPALPDDGAAPALQFRPFADLPKAD